MANESTTKQRILLVDDHEIVRLGLKALLERHPNFEVVAEAGTAKDAIEKVETFKPGCCRDGHPFARWFWD